MNTTDSSNLFKSMINQTFISTCLVYISICTESTENEKSTNVGKFMNYLDDNSDLWIKQHKFDTTKTLIKEMLEYQVRIPGDEHFLIYQIKFGFICDQTLEDGSQCNNKPITDKTCCYIHNKINNFKTYLVKTHLSIPKDLQNIVIDYL